MEQEKNEKIRLEELQKKKDLEILLKKLQEEEMLKEKENEELLLRQRRFHQNLSMTQENIPHKSGRKRNILERTIFQNILCWIPIGSRGPGQAG